MTYVRDYDPAKGQAFQGDVCIFLVPAEIAKSLARHNEVAPIEGRLILQAGEFSGHHHAIRLPEPRNYYDDEMARKLIIGKGSRAAQPIARMFRDPTLAAALVNACILTRSDLCVGFLEIENGPMTVTHEEHDGIKLWDGVYYCGRQIESVGAEQRIVID